MGTKQDLPTSFSIPTASVRVVKTRYSSDSTSAKLIQAVQTKINSQQIQATFETGRYLVPDEQHGLEDILCLSSQIGCAMACTFCLSTKPFEYIPGLPPRRILRNLTAQEIYQQAQNSLQEVPPKTNHIVFSFMGMGEPFANIDEVKKSILLLSDSYANSRTTLCTIAHDLQAIKQLADEINQGQYQTTIKLHISLHAPKDQQRKQIIPFAQPIQDTIATAQYYAKTTQTKVKLNYVLVLDSNSREQDAHTLGRLLKNKPELILKISDLNPPTNPNYVPKQQADIFEQIVQSYKVQTTRFQSHGTDIGAGCGELVKGIF